MPYFWKDIDGEDLLKYKGHPSEITDSWWNVSNMVPMNLSISKEVSKKFVVLMFLK